MKYKIEINSINDKCYFNNKKSTQSPLHLIFVIMFSINVFANGSPVAIDDSGTRIEDIDGTSNATNIPVLVNDLNEPNEVIGVTQASFGVVEISINNVFLQPTNPTLDIVMILIIQRIHLHIP